jgi:hypothetical protein
MWAVRHLINFSRAERVRDYSGTASILWFLSGRAMKSLNAYLRTSGCLSSFLFLMGESLASGNFIGCCEEGQVQLLGHSPRKTSNISH